jgi:hypothetical protein
MNFSKIWYWNPFFFFCVGLGWDWFHLAYRPPLGPDDRWIWSNWWNENWQGKPKYSEKICLYATLSITNPTWCDLGSSPSHCSGKLVTNYLRYGMAYLTPRSCKQSFVLVNTGSHLLMNQVWKHQRRNRKSISQYNLSLAADPAGYLL